MIGAPWLVKTLSSNSLGSKPWLSLVGGAARLRNVSPLSLTVRSRFCWFGPSAAINSSKSITMPLTLYLSVPCGVRTDSTFLPMSVPTGVSVGACGFTSSVGVSTTSSVGVTSSAGGVSPLRGGGASMGGCSAGVTWAGAAWVSLFFSAINNSRRPATADFSSSSISAIRFSSLVSVFLASPPSVSSVSVGFGSSVPLDALGSCGAAGPSSIASSDGLLGSNASLPPV